MKTNYKLSLKQTVFSTDVQIKIRTRKHSAWILGSANMNLLHNELSGMSVEEQFNNKQEITAMPSNNKLWTEYFKTARKSKKRKKEKGEVSKRNQACIPPSNNELGVCYMNFCLIMGL